MSQLGEKQVAFRLSRDEQAALRLWITRSYGDASPSLHEAVRAIVLQRLHKDGLLTEDGSVAVRVPKRQRRREEISGDDLSTARTKRGLTQVELASIFGMSRSTVAQWETGSKRVPPRLIEIVAAWIKTGTAPQADELERRERRTVWARLLDDDPTDS